MGYQKPPVELASQHIIHTIGLFDTRGKKDIKNPVSAAGLEDPRLPSETGSKGVPQRHGSHMAPRVQQSSTLSAQYNCPARPCDAPGLALMAQSASRQGGR
jgi:hypothetical protein